MLLTIPIIFLGLFLYNTLRGQTPHFFTFDFSPESDADYKSRVIELAASVKRKSGGAFNIKPAGKNIKRQRSSLHKLLDTAELPLYLLRDEFRRQKVVFWKYYFTPKNSLFPLLYFAVRQGEGKINGKSLSNAVNFFNTEKYMTTLEIDCMRDMLGAILLWYIGEQCGELNSFCRGDIVSCIPSTKKIYNACVSLSMLDDFWQPHKTNYIDKDFIPLNNLLKYPRVLALGQNIITDRGRDFCEVFVDGESIFDTTAVSISPYAFKYTKGGRDIITESICTVNAGDNSSLLLCTLFSKIGKTVEIEVRGVFDNSEIFITLNGVVYDIIKTGGVFRVWVDNKINFEVIGIINRHCEEQQDEEAHWKKYLRRLTEITSPKSIPLNDLATRGRDALILSSLLYKSDPIASDILSRVFYDCSYIALEISGNSGLSRFISLLPSLKYAKQFASFEVYLIFHQRDNSLIDYQKEISDLLKDRPSDFVHLINTAVTPFDGNFYYENSPNPIIKIFPSDNSLPVITNSLSINIPLPQISTPNPSLNTKLSDYAQISVNQIFNSAPIYYGITGQLTSAFLLPYISLETLKDFILHFCNLQERHGEIYGAYQNGSLLAGLVAQYIQVSGETDFLLKRTYYKDKSLGTILEHALRSIEYCHYNNLTMPLTYEFLGKFLPYIKNSRTLKNCLNIISVSSPTYNDPDYPGILFHSFVEKTLGITKQNVDTLKFNPKLPGLWKSCDIILNNTTYQLLRQNNSNIIIEEDGRDLIKDTICVKGREGKFVRVKY